MNFLAFTFWHWLGIGIILLIAEVILGGLSVGFLLWIGLSALAVSFITWTIPTLSWSSQMLLFAGLAIVVSVCWWAYLKRNPIKSADNKLNRRNEQYVGRTFTLIEAIHNGRGKIHVDDSTWTVKGPDLPIGTTVKITRAEGTILIAEKADS